MQSPEVSVVKSQGVVGGDGDEVGRCQFEEDAEAELRRNESRGGRGRGEKVELGEDAFILPTGNYPNNTCISSTPVAHRLSSEGTGDGECRGSERGRRVEGDGQRGERNIINCGHERRNNGIIVESADYVIHRRRSEKPFLYLFRYRVLAVSRYARSLFLLSLLYLSLRVYFYIFNPNDKRAA